MKIVYFCYKWCYNKNWVDLGGSEIKQAGLSWGSVQAETVRLQRQIDPGLMDIHLNLLNFVVSSAQKKLR